MEMLVASSIAWLLEHGATIAAQIGLRSLAQWLIRKATTLRSRPPPRAFVTPEEYFQPYLSEPSKSLIRHDVVLVERGQDVDILTKGILDQNWSIVIITAPPGQGKSRFALELAGSIGIDRRNFLQKLSFQGPRWKTYFVKSGMVDVLNQVEKLPRRNPIALFFDDAASNPQLVGALAEYASANNDGQPLVLILTSRAYLLPAIRSVLPEASLGHIHEHRLKRLSVDGIEKIYDQLATGLSSTNKKRFIQLTKDSPFLTVLLCRAITSGVPLSNHLSDEQLRHKLCDEPIEKATMNCGISFSKVLVTLAAISAATPYERRNGQLREPIKKLAEIDDVEFDCILQGALDSGLFIEYGSGKIRPAPDLVGDLILDRTLISETSDTPTEIASRLVAEFLPIIPKQILNNLADLGWIRGASQVDLIEPILLDYRQQALSRNASELHALLEILQPVSVRRAGSVLDIIEALWERIYQMGPINTKSMREWRLLLGAATPLLSGASYADEGLVRSMQLAKELYKNAAVETGYDNQKPANLLIEMAGFSPYRSLGMTTTAMAELERWFELGSSDAIVALEALAHVLSGTVNWTDSGSASVTFNSQVLHLGKDAIAIRDRAIQIVERGILSDDPQVCEKALDILDHLGRCNGGAGYTPDSQMALRVRTEKLQLLHAMERIIAEERPYRILRKLEKQLWHWWCFADELVAKRSADLLCVVPSDPAYRISKGIFDADIPMETTVPTQEEIGTLSRSEYYFRECHDEFSLEKVMADLSQLGLADSVNQWATFLREIAVGEGPTAWRAITVFEAIARSAPTVAVRLVTDFNDEPWSDNSGALLSAARVANRALWSSELCVALENPELSEQLAFAWLISLDWENQFDETQKAFVDKCLSMSSSRLTQVIVNNLAHRNGFTWEESLRKLFRIADTVPTDEHILDQVYSKLAHGRGNPPLGEAISDLDKQALLHLLKVQATESIPWEKPYWVGVYLKFIAKNHPFEFLGFFRESLNQLPTVSIFHYKILGAKNAEEPIKELLNGPLRQAHLSALFEIASEETTPGAFVRAVLANTLPVNDACFQQRIEKALIENETIKAAVVLSGYDFSLDWLGLCTRVLRKSEALSLDRFNKVASILDGPFWEGTRSRSIGKPSEHDSLISQACTGLSKDATLPPRTREFFRRQMVRANQSIEHDLKSDEELIGTSLL